MMRWSISQESRDQFSPRKGHHKADLLENGCGRVLKRRKLTLNDDAPVTSHSVSSASKVMHPQVPLALRLSAILMSGIVRIQAKKYEFTVSIFQTEIAKLRTKEKGGENAHLLDDVAKKSLDKITISEKLAVPSAHVDDFIINIGSGCHMLTFSVDELAGTFIRRSANIGK